MTLPSFPTTAPVPALVLGLLCGFAACGGGASDPGTPGTAGTFASAGTTGAAGTSSAGSAGTTGRGGSAPAGRGGTGVAGATGTAGSFGPGMGKTANLFTTLGGRTQAEVDSKVTTAVNRFFGIGTGEAATPTAGTGYRCYYELPQDPSLAFIWAADSDDVRSEGMSYGMMIAVQMDLHAQFDRLWKFSKTYMQFPANTGTTAWKYYFRWQGTVSRASASSWSVGFDATTGPAPDGDEYFAAALYLAHRRWGSAGTVNYKQEADNIAAAMLHNAATSDGRYPIISTSNNMVVFYPYGGSNGFTDPSYHVPAFYALYAEVGPAADSARWRSLAATSRAFLVSSAHGTTGLHPDYASFSGMPRTAAAGDGHDEFRFDAWRVVMNMALDHAWSSSSASMKTQIEKYHAFFADKLVTGNVSNSLFRVDGTMPSGGGSTALTGTLATGSLVSAAPSRASYVNNLWMIAQQSGLYRYYQETLYLMSLLAVAGKFNAVF